MDPPHTTTGRDSSLECFIRGVLAEEHRHPDLGIPSLPRNTTNASFALSPSWVTKLNMEESDEGWPSLASRRRAKKQSANIRIQLSHSSTNLFPNPAPRTSQQHSAAPARRGPISPPPAPPLPPPVATVAGEEAAESPPPSGVGAVKSSGSRYADELMADAVKTYKKRFDR